MNEQMYLTAMNKSEAATDVNTEWKQIAKTLPLKIENEKTAKHFSSSAWNDWSFLF